MLKPTRSLKRTSFCQKLTNLEQIVDSFMPKESTNNPQPKLDLSPTSSCPSIISTSQYHSQPAPPSPLDHSQCDKLTTYNSSHTQSRNISSFGSSSNKDTFKDPVTKLIWELGKLLPKHMLLQTTFTWL